MNGPPFVAVGPRKDDGASPGTCGDIDPNVTGRGVIAEAFEEAMA
jgi:hypothetical protein